MARKKIPADRLRAILSYDPGTGEFYWKAGKRAGKRAGCLSPTGYWVIKVEKVLYRAHRLAWLYMTKSWPSDQIDHRNRDKIDNRWNNLRSANASQNAANRKRSALNTSGFKGVHKGQRGGWRAMIRIDGVKKHLGSFKTPEEAHAVYVKAATRVYGRYARAS